MASERETAIETLPLLQQRLRRVDFVLNGDEKVDVENASSHETAGSAIARLRALERKLQALAAQSVTVSDVLSLQKQHPELFHPSNASHVPSTLPPASLASLVLAHSQLYHTLSAKLPQLQDVSVPDPAATAKLIELHQRIGRAQSKQDTQAREFADLRTRSAAALEAWYEDGVLGMGERWADWEERLRAAEILVRRREAAKKRDDGTV